MITELFLNSCFSVILCKKSKIVKNKTLYRDILEILSFYEKKEKIEIPVIVSNKLQCLRKICNMLIEDKTIDTIIDSVSFGEKFAEFRDFLTSKCEEEIRDNKADEIIKQIRLRKKINGLFSNYDSLSDVLDSIREGSFESIDNLIEDYEVTIKQLYSNMMESNRIVNVEASSSIDLIKDNYEHVIKLIQKKYERKNTTSTGFSIFDNQILHGGFEPSRLYIFGGGSGSGKSTLLNNLIVNSATSKIQTFNREEATKNKDGINKVYIYITLENTIDEALLRTYQPLFSKNLNEVLSEISSGVDIRERISSELSKNGSTIIMKYFPAMSISVIDLMMVVDDIISQYGKEYIKGIYVDYLDLLKTDMNYDLYRLQLGHVTLSLKTFAVEYNIPVITVSQLGRSAYEIKDSESLSLTQMSESIKKIEHADFVCLLGKDKHDDSKVHMRVGKNRSGPSNISLTFKVDFNLFKFIHGSRVSNSAKNDIMKDIKQGGFIGFDDDTF